MPAPASWATGRIALHSRRARPGPARWRATNEIRDRSMAGAKRRVEKIHRSRNGGAGFCRTQRLPYGRSALKMTASRAWNYHKAGRAGSHTMGGAIPRRDSAARRSRTWPSRRKRERMRVRDVFSEASNSTRLQVVVCNQDGHRVGLMVERIVDMVEDVAELKYPASRPGNPLLRCHQRSGYRTDQFHPFRITGVSFMQQPQGEINLATGRLVMASTLQFCTFYLDQLLFGVEIQGVQEVIAIFR